MEMKLERGFWRSKSEAPPPAPAPPPGVPLPPWERNVSGKDADLVDAYAPEEPEAQELSDMEKVEELVHDLSSKELCVSGQKLHELVKVHLPELVHDAKKGLLQWCRQHAKAFEVRSDEPTDWHVALQPVAVRRVRLRVEQRLLERARMLDLGISEQMLTPQLSESSLPSSLAPTDLAGLLCALAKGKHEKENALAKTVMARLTQRAIE
eukprot:709884-Amphidinium_carterae.1